MASSKTSSSFYNMPHRSGTYMANHGASATSEVTPDLHLKMSKKIAQLTKVIYALNTKNDEHDAFVEGLKKSHEEELQQLIAETKDKIDSFQARLTVVSEQKHKIEVLESIVSKERLQKEEALSDFENMKRQYDDKQSILQQEYSDKILLMSKEMLSSKKEFEDRLKDFQAMRRKLEDDRDKMVKDLSSKHHEELEQLMKAHRVRYDEVVREKQKIEQENKELEVKIKEQFNSSTSLANDEKKKLEKEYQEKVEKLKVFYEKELEALRAAQAQSSELNSKCLEEREKQLKAEWSRQERLLKERISELLNRQSDNEREISELNNQISELQALSDGRDGVVENLSLQLEESKQETSSALRDVRELQNELLIYRKRYEEKTTEIARQSSVIGKLEANKLSQETNLQSLKSNINKLNNNLSKLQSSYDELEQQYKSHFLESGEHIETLKDEIKKITNEKKEIELKYLRELNNSKDTASERENNLRKQLEETTSRLKADHEKEIEQLHKEMKEKLTVLEKELKEQSEIERENIIKAKTSEVMNLEKDCLDLKKSNENLESECKRLLSLVQESEKGLGSASSNLQSLKKMLKDTTEAWEGTKQELNEVTNNSISLKNELVSLQKKHEESKVEAQNKLQSSLKTLTKELDDKWSKTLRDEIDRLRSELNDQHSKENTAALEELTRIKEMEREEMRKDLENRIEILRKTVRELESDKELLVQNSSDMIKDLQDSLEKRKANASNVEQQLRDDLEKQRRKHEEEMARLALNHNNKIKEMGESHEQEIKRMEDLGEQQLQELGKHLQTKYQDGLASNLQANKVALDAMKSQAELTRKKQIEELLAKQEDEKESLRNELLRKQQEDMQQLNKEFETQMMALKLQLQRTNEIMTRQEAEHQTKVDDITHELELKDSEVTELYGEISELKNNVAKLEEELQSKGQEILTVRREANSQIRKREECLGRLHQEEIDSLTSEHLSETKGLVDEFNRAKELQNSKISALQLMLEEAEIRFKNRESRPEDTEMIDTLKRALADRELEMKKLVEEKRYFQMELLNRETNFNKVFSTSPNVGVINPLNSKTRIMTKTKTVSKNNGLFSTSKLDPIPNMPVHEKRLNNTKPLPPTPPKDPSPHRTVVY